MLLMGLDIGTQGVRAVVTTENGDILAAHSVGFEILNCSLREGGYEQEPEVWWRAACRVLKSCQQELEKKPGTDTRIAALSIDGTSATVLPLDHKNQPLSPALMYNDTRAKEEAERIRRAGAGLEKKMGYQFHPSFALPKILWMKEHRPRIHEKTARYVHQADYLVGKLCGIYHVTDYSNALKTGYDLVEEKWPDFFTELGLDTALFPEVLPPGRIIKKISPQTAEELGLNPEMLIVSGATDGYTSALAAGAVKPGDWASIIGTTMVLKGVTQKLFLPPGAGTYSHKLPSGAWMLGGAANIGGRCLNDAFPKEEFEERNTHVKEVIPTGVISYPLHGKGERFPFADDQAEGFLMGDIRDENVHYAALMEGVAYAERFAFEQMEALGAEVGGTVYTTGGVCRSQEWLQIRASVLNRNLRVPRIVDAAMGCAMLAAAGTCYDTLEEASEHMIQIRQEVPPVPELIRKYEELYQKAKEEYQKRFRTGGGL